MLRLMDVLSIGLDDSILDSDALGDTQERHIDYADALAERSEGTLHSVVLSPDGRPFDRREITDNLVAYPTQPLSRYTFAYDAYRTGARVCRRNDVGVVTTQTPFDDGLAGALLARRYDAAYLAQLRPANLDDPEWVQEQLINRPQRSVGKQLLKRADAVRVTNRQGHNWIRNSLGVPDDRVYLNYTPITMLKGGRQHDRGTTDPMNVTFVGRLTEVKRVSDLLRAFRTVVDEHPEATLTIVGDGPEREPLETLARDRSLADTVEFVGAVDYDDIGSYYAAAGVLALPSSRETFGRVILEAFAHRTPVVATETWGASETIEPGETGLLVPRHQPDALADALSSLLDDPDERARLGANAQASVSERFDPDTLAGALADTWVDVGNAAGNSRA